MVFSIPRILSYISHIMTLEPGDLIATGTPAGVGRLSPGDTVDIDLVDTSSGKHGKPLVSISNPVVGSAAPNPAPR
jgi:2-keto-4-pentenoate hydratase/2-oxohepta-3-ene-1,7-dioic acid hydratase in catechol pathway